MSCCSPEYRKVVIENEKKVKRKGRDSLPLSLKIIFSLITVGGIIIAFFH
ncbi:hypothetical protein [Metabacillus sp. Hm71]